MNYKIYFCLIKKLKITNKRFIKIVKLFIINHKNILKFDLFIFSSSSVIDYAIIYKKKILRIFSDEVKSYPVCTKCDNDLYKFFKISSLNLDKLETKNQILDKIMLPNRIYKKYENMFIKHPKSKNVKYSKLIKRIINLK